MTEIGKPIAYGRTAEIYSWPQGQVLKLFYDWYEPEKIECEFHINRAIQASGLPIPSVGEMVRVNGRMGIEYEQIRGESMWVMFQHRPWNAIGYIKRLARLMVRIHNTTLPHHLPSQKDEIRRHIKNARALSADQRDKILTLLEILPKRNVLCHGDFWPGNVLVTSKGDYIIDWIRASHGTPLGDLAWTTNLVKGYTLTNQVNRPFLSYGKSKLKSVKNLLLQVFCRMCYPEFLNEYFHLTHSNPDEYRRWLPVVAAARLCDDIPELEKLLMEEVKKGINQ